MKKIVTLAAVVSLTLPAWSKPDLKRGKAKSAVCAACHGANGISPSPVWPNLAGQKYEYMVQQLKKFQSGERKNALMMPILKDLTEQDFKDISAYYASLKP